MPLEITVRRSLWMTAGYTSAALLFCIYVWHTMGSVPAMQFLTVFSLEKLLSMDNLLVMFLIFQYFGIPKKWQHRALTYGLVGAVIFRTSIILSGVYAIHNLHWILYLFAIFLMYSGCKLMIEKDGGYDASESVVVSYLRNNLGSIGVFFSCIIAVELSDIVFAVDSIPASFGVTQNSFIIMSANLFAVLGLRSLYHAVSHGLEFFSGIERYIGIVLILVGINVFAKIPEVFFMPTIFSVLCFGAVFCRREKIV